VDELLREISAQVHLVFVDSDELPEAYLLLGDYRVANGKTTVVVKLFKGEKEAGEFMIAGDSSGMEKLAADIVKEAERRMASSK
jgi:hypothetical protein